LFVKGDQVWFSEVSPRPHDTGMVTLLSQRQSEFDLHARAILGLPVCTALQNIAASAVILGGVDAKAVEYHGLEQALAIADSEVRLFGKPEAFVTRRMGVALATAENVASARAKAVAAANRIKILTAS
jgi:phosphoribosylglycinamide formyltransferase 2